MSDDIQRVVLMGQDETKTLVPMPFIDGGTSTTIASIPGVDVDSMPSLTIGSMPTLTMTDTGASTRRLLSGSTNGKAIKVVATASTGTTIHTAITGTTQVDCIELWAVNSDTTDRKLTIEWGETTAPDGNIELTIPAEDGLVQITPDGGLMLQNGLLVTAFAATANVICIHGRVTRRTLNA